MYRKCTTEKAALQQRRFQHALLQAMQQLPYPEITVTALCSQTGLSRKTFYRLFENKDDVLNALIDQAEALKPTEDSELGVALAHAKDALSQRQVDNAIESLKGILG